ncbi:MAG: uroporphyrinogen-III C-methyltransferase [Pseudomonadota bacterium]|nr:uroporphyrinogen-III C-methyltransferase [Pseudomonadota bacterium]
MLLLGLLAVAALGLAWTANQRVRSSERELVQRQQESADRVVESTMLARQAQEGLRDASAKVALLEARLNESTLQRTQLEDMIQSVARSRDDNLLNDIESSLRAAVQQAELTGSGEPLVAVLKQADERLVRANQPRLEPVRRAIARDLDHVKATSQADVATLSIRLDEVVRMVDEMPLLSAAEPRRDFSNQGGQLGGRAAAAAPAASSAATATPEAKAADASLWAVDGIGLWAARQLAAAGRFVADDVWTQIRALVRITRIDQPEAMLVAPDQAFFLRENLKLRLLNARLALLARQFEAAQVDLKWTQGAIDRYFDRSSQRTQLASDLLQQVALQARQAKAARPDNTLAALSAAGPR